MRKIISMSLVLAMLLALSVSFTSCKKYAGEVNVYNWGEYMPDGEDGSMDVLKEFEKRYNIKVNYKEFDSNETLYAELKPGNTSYDVVVPSDYMISRMIEEDMLEKINFENIPNYSKIMEAYKKSEYDPTGEYSVPYSWGTVGIIYNKTMVKETVDSWDILWDKKYKDKIFMFDTYRDTLGVALKNVPVSLSR